MTDSVEARERCVFCAICAGDAEASIVYEDDEVVAFMDLFPVTRGHLLVIPRDHHVGLSDLPPAVGERLWGIGQQLADALRASSIPCEGINLLVCDGEVAYQSVFHFHLHVIPRTEGDGWTSLRHLGAIQEREQLDADARLIRDALRFT